MPSALPDGEPVPLDGSLPASSLAGLGERPFAIYLHVPFCRVRCGYCDFNTYTLPELGSGPPHLTGATGSPGGASRDAGATGSPGGASRDARAAGSPGGASLYDDYVGNALAEIDLSARVLARGGGTLPTVATVFVGGGTPTMLRPAALVAMLQAIRERFGLADDAEVTTEANPDTITPAVARELVDGGFTRISLGMQSAVPHVLATLDRTHDPANVTRAVAAAREAGLAVSLDLIYGTPGESLADWRTSLQAALSMEPDHVSAYALVVEDGTALARRVRRGEVPTPEDDDEAAKYELADELLAAGGYEWYEVSNWARDPGQRCRHNLSYWRGDDWWGIGPGAHSHVGGVRWWNVRHPRAYADRLEAGQTPALGRELLTAEQRYDETVLLGARLADGLPLDQVAAPGRGALSELVADGLVESAPLSYGNPRIVPTLRGRLLSDTIVRRLLLG